MDSEIVEDRYIKINNLRLHYRDWGSSNNQKMLLLHGFMGHSHVWDDFSFEFRNHYHIIALDQRGHGESQWSKEAIYSIDEHFSDFTQFVETLGFENFALIGHSMGGRNALFYSACFPEKVNRLILVDSRLGNSPMSCNSLREQLIHYPTQADSLAQVVESIQTLYPYMPEETSFHIAKHGYNRTEHGKYFLKFDTRMNLYCEKAEYGVENIWPFIDNISCPTLVIRGVGSPFISREDAEKICRLLPNSILREIPRATHLPAQENLEEFRRVVSEFLKVA